MSARDVIERMNCQLTCGDMGEQPCWQVGPRLDPPVEYKACDGCQRAASATLAMLESAGYVVVPKEPTERMLKAYYDCMDKPKPPSPRNKATTMMNPNKFLQHTHKATVRYKAMLSAAKEAGE